MLLFQLINVIWLKRLLALKAAWRTRGKIWEQIWLDKHCSTSYTFLIMLSMDVKGLAPPVANKIYHMWMQLQLILQQLDSFILILKKLPCLQHFKACRVHYYSHYQNEVQIRKKGKESSCRASIHSCRSSRSLILTFMWHLELSFFILFFLLLFCLLSTAFVFWLLWLLLLLIWKSFDLWLTLSWSSLDSIFWRFKTISNSILCPFCPFCHGIWSLPSQCWSYGCPLGYTWSFDQYPPASRIGWQRL